ncbi:tetratricopeptide repeat protein [Pararhodonellum marinum]|uniref:tetratricopeptide repeat protein n=1 Tax=Pararhodonellum marinum TaxID=2755358 RepID=UPI00188F7695|nr:tetratricopeptide repeat protein [Pararhodonellum marinum]
MRKLLLSLALVGITAVAFGQKKVVRSAEKNFKKGDLEVAYQEVNQAIQDPETGQEPDTYLLKGKIETKMFEAGSAQEEATVSTGRKALDTFQQTMEMVGNDKDSKIGKEIYKDFIPDMPENLSGQAMYKLKSDAFVKAVDRYEEDDLEMAFEFFALAADADRTDTTMLFNSGYLANMIGKNEESKKYLMPLLEIEDYNKLNAYYFLIQMASQDDDKEEAYRLVSEAREIYPEDTGLQETEIQLLLQLDKMDDAMASIEEALKTDPNNTGIRLRYGYLKEQSGDVDGALAEYSRTVEIDPEFFDGNFYTGALYLDKARKIISEVNNLPDDEWEKKADKMMTEADDIYKSALPYFTKASELQPDNTDILEILFQVHTRLKNADKAEEYNQKLIAKKGANWMDE